MILFVFLNPFCTVSSLFSNAAAYSGCFTGHFTVSQASVSVEVQPANTTYGCKDSDHVVLLAQTITGKFYKRTNCLDRRSSV